jgi:hypothetical protein
MLNPSVLFSSNLGSLAALTLLGILGSLDCSVSRRLREQLELRLQDGNRDF